MFFKDPRNLFDDAELIAYAALNVDTVVLEFSGDRDFDRIAQMLHSFAQQTYKVERAVLHKCAAVI